MRATVSENSRLFFIFAISLFTMFMYVSCGGGSSSSTTPTTPVVQAKTVNVFVTDLSDSKINNFTIDRASGAVLKTQTLTMTDNTRAPFTILVHPNKKWIYTMNLNGDTPGDASVTRFSYANGILKQEDTLNLSYFQGRSSLSMAPSGNFMFVANDVTNVRGIISINSTTGVMTQQEGSATSANIVSSATNAAGTETFLSMNATDELGLYNNDPTTGGTSGGGTLESLSYTPSKLIINPVNSNMLIVASSAGNKLVTHSYNSAGPSTTLLHSMSTTIAPDDFTWGTIGSTHYIFTASYNDKKLASYSINGSGVISAEIDVETIATPVNSQPIDIEFLAGDSSSKNLLLLADRAYGTNGQLGVYEVSSTGQITFISSAPAFDAQGLGYIANE